MESFDRTMKNKKIDTQLEMKCDLNGALGNKLNRPKKVFEFISVRYYERLFISECNSIIPQKKRKSWKRVPHGSDSIKKIRPLLSTMTFP
jgi:hypothetical protein